MKRIALLVATVFAAAGCTVDRCDPSALQVNWSFTAGTCAAAGVNNVDVYVDDVLVASAMPCTDYGGTLQNIAGGYHSVMVEGFNGGTIVNRDWDDAVNVADCGQTTFNAYPGDGVIEFLPTSCANSTLNPLTYDLWDDTRLVSYSISADLPGATWVGYYDCGGGIAFSVPYGYYSLRGIEEVNATAASVYAYTCSSVPASVLTPAGSTTYVTLAAGSAGCF